MTITERHVCDLCTKEYVSRKAVSGDLAIYDGSTLTSYTDVCAVCAKKVATLIADTFPKQTPITRTVQTQGVPLAVSK
jgi:hypothetical protein